ncbi:MAG TPA: FliI/YscN family ATPase [Pirellulales bacterium]|jgi:flagellum-specific ATP synthase|nr:FliI/YscN family ATPase [Pirellulales bacterium]
MASSVDDLLCVLPGIVPAALEGRVVRTMGLAAAVADFPAPVGAVVEIERLAAPAVRGEVIGFRDDATLVYLTGDAAGIRRGDRVRLTRTACTLQMGPELLGRVVNSEGAFIDGKPRAALPCRTTFDPVAISATERPRIDTALSTGIRAIDALLTCGKGQRIGLFAGAGIGKSMALGMITRLTQADVNVVALVGERGREVNEFIERELGAALDKSVVVVATSDEPAIARVRAAHAAATIAEFFRDQGNDVLLVMDSLTRWALAQREIGLAAGEAAGVRGYPPSVYSALPRLLERCGRTQRGSITAFYSVLAEGDDPNEPISDAVRGLLDGHVWLSRKLAARGHYPAIDVLDSVSRLMTDVADREHRAAAETVRSVLAAYREHEDLVSVGAYRRGTMPLVDVALEMRDEIDAFLRQRLDEPSSLAETRQQLMALAEWMRAHLNGGSREPGAAGVQ